MCWAAKGLIVFCVGYLPQPGSSITLKRSCVAGYSKEIQDAAKSCAAEHDVKYTITKDR